MSEENYELDKWGGHAERPSADGNYTSIPMLGCGTCPAAFFNMPARKAHIETMHPTENSGPSPDMIHMARVSPEWGKALGISPEEANAPQNVHEFEAQERIKDVVKNQNENAHKLDVHPVMRPMQEAMSHVRMMEAAALANEPEQYHHAIREHAAMAHEHLLQYGHATAGNGSVLRPEQHTRQAHDHMDELASYTNNWEHHEGENSEHIANVIEAAYPHED